ncbi:Uncharacterised protein [Mycobacteroides abscessus subsp. abscessus]|nr:Uncharacterised protein [Mycobacteroides abscessus subsp. abscessus]
MAISPATKCRREGADRSKVNAMRRVCTVRPAADNGRGCELLAGIVYLGGSMGSAGPP